jgi:hypothetical protein
VPLGNICGRLKEGAEYEEYTRPIPEADDLPPSPSTPGTFLFIFKFSSKKKENARKTRNFWFPARFFPANVLIFLDTASPKKLTRPLDFFLKRIIIYK